MKLIVGLGNIGKEYQNTRHNVGFMVLDSYIQNNGWQKKFDGEYQIINYGSEKVMFLKPLTFMNNSGLSVVQASRYYDIEPEDILVIQDDMDIEFGHHKLKKNSSAGGHNGIKSIISALNTDSFARLKIGISHDKNKDTIHYVLGKFSKEEMNTLNKNYKIYNEIIESFIYNGIERTMNKYNF